MALPSETPPEGQPVLSDAELLERAAFASLPMHQKRNFIPTVTPTSIECPGSEKKPKSVTNVGNVINGTCVGICNNLFRFNPEKGWELPEPLQPTQAGK